MTLVVSDISHLGIVMVGDSAVTQQCSDLPPQIVSGAVKVQYSEIANVGVAMWGHADVSNQRLDYWMAEFLQNSIKSSDSVEDIGIKIADKLNPILIANGKAWKDMVCGFHVTGYRQGLPCLFHVHCGHYNEPAHELRLYKDFPDDKGWSEQHFEFMLRYGVMHLRNGYHPLFGPLFDRVKDYSNSLRSQFDISFPQRTLHGRLKFYKLLVRFVAGVLDASGEYQRVNDQLSAIAFSNDGLIINEQLPLQCSEEGIQGDLTNYFLSDRNRSSYPKYKLFVKP